MSPRSDERERREQRLAAKLRENLRRRKEQARARLSATPGKPESDTKDGPDGGALPPDRDSDS